MNNKLKMVTEDLGILVKKVIRKKETQEHTFDINLPKEIVHYIEFEADKTPVFREVKLDLGELDLTLPTVTNPKWTGNFNDDTEQMILARAIFGEARNQPRKVKITVGWSIRNRLGKDVHPWRNYRTYHDVILDEDQYKAFTDPNVRPRVEDPLNTADPTEKQAWYESYEIANLVINGLVKDESEGAVFFHDPRTSQEKFLRDNPNAKYIKQIGNLLFYGLKNL